MVNEKSYSPKDRHRTSCKSENNNSMYSKSGSSLDRPKANGSCIQDYQGQVLPNETSSAPVKPLRNGDVTDDADMRKSKRWPTDKAYFISKELLMTERTYKKDLDVINVVSI